MKASTFFSGVVAALALSGCTSTGSNAFTLAANTTITAKFVLLAGVATYLLYDPLAPNWEIEEIRLSDESYLLSMKMKRFHTGGAGEALQILKRRAGQLQREQGFSDYQIASYSEGIDSQTLGTRRVAEGAVRFRHANVADSFVLNGTFKE